MTYRTARGWLVAACLLLPAAGIAADLLPVADFARHPQLTMPRLSPDGKYIAMNMNDASGDSHALVIYKVDDMSHPVSMLRMPKYEMPAQITWVSPTRLLVEKGKEYGSIGKPSGTGEILATDVDGKHQDYLYGYEAARYGRRAGTRGTDRGFGSIDGLPEHANGHFYMGAQSWDEDNISSLYDVDAVHNNRHLIGDIGVGGMSFMTGPQGQARYAYGTNNDFDYVVYHRQGNAWIKLDPEVIGKRFAPFTYAPDPGQVYAYWTPDGGPLELVEQGEDNANRKVLAKDDFGSVGNLLWTPIPARPFAAVLDTGVPKAIYIDPALPAAKLHQALSQKFPGSFVDFIDYSEDGKQLLFSVSSDRLPGSYFLIDTTTYKVRKLFDLAPWIDPATMAERRPVRFKASDGQELEAILTCPRALRHSTCRWCCCHTAARMACGTTGSSMATRSSWPTAATWCCRSTTAARAGAARRSRRLAT